MLVASTRVPAVNWAKFFTLEKLGHSAKQGLKETCHCYIFITCLNFPSLVPLISATGNLQEDKEMNDVSMGKDDSAHSGVSFYPLPRNTANQEQESLHIKLLGIQE